MLKRLIVVLTLLYALLPWPATAQPPIPTPSSGGPFGPIGTLSVETRLYAGPSVDHPYRVVPAGTILLGAVARTREGWVWVATASDELGWLAPDNAGALTIPLITLPILPSDFVGAATAPAPTAVPAPTTAPAAPAPPAADSATSLLSLLPLGLIALGILLVGILSLRSMSLRRRLTHEERQRAAVESQLSELTQHTSDALLLVTPRGQVLEANDRAAVFLNRPVEQIRGAMLPNLMDSQLASNLLEDTLVMGHVQREAVTLRPDATNAVNLDGRTVTRNGSQLVRLLMRDVTNQRQMEGELRARHRELAALYEVATTVSRSLDRQVVLGTALDQLMRVAEADAGIVLLIGDGSARVWSARGVSPAFGRRNLAPAESALLAQVLQSTTPWVIAQLPATQDTLVDALNNEGVSSLAVVPLLAHNEETGAVLLAARRPRAFDTGDLALFEVIGAQVGVAIETARLFQELGETVRSLSDIKLFSESVFQNMTNGLVTLDQNGIITSVNPAAEQILGVTPAETTGHPLSRLRPPASLEEMVGQVLRLGTTYTGHDLVISHADDEQIPIRLSVAPLRNDDGQTVGAVLVFDDMREQRQMEEDRRRLDRLALLGEMSTILAHEVRNPLSSISTGIQYLAEQSRPGDPMHESLHLLVKESGRLKKLLEDILLISRPERPHLVECSLPEIIDVVLLVSQGLAALHNVRLIREFDPDTPLVRGDPVRLDQAISNLVTNGIQAMPDGGTLTVRVRLAESQETAADDGPPSALPGPHAVIEIQDTGIGMSEEVLAKIFTPFFTTKSSGTGTGLGLTITQRIIIEHGGDLRVASTEGQGTTFTIRLPAVTSGGPGGI